MFSLSTSPKKKKKEVSFYCEGDCAQAGNSPLLETSKKLTGHGHGQSAVGDPPCLSRGLDQMTSRSPLPPQPFCDAHIDDNRLTLFLEEKDHRAHVGPEEIQESSWPGSWGQ